MSLVITTRGLWCRAMMFCIVGTTPDTSLVPVLWSTPIKLNHLTFVIHLHLILRTQPWRCFLPCMNLMPMRTTSMLLDYKLLQPMFGLLPADVIKQMFEVIIQYAHLLMRPSLKRSTNLLVPLSMFTGGSSDTIYSDTPSVDSRCYHCPSFCWCGVPSDWCLCH